MHTRCPDCLAVFDTDDDALRAASGVVRCGLCGCRFDARVQSLDAPPPGGPEPRPPASSTPADPGGPGDDEPVLPDDPDDWFDGAAGDPAAQLIADAAGLPPEALAEAGAWEVPDPHRPGDDGTEPPDAMADDAAAAEDPGDGNAVVGNLAADAPDPDDKDATPADLPVGEGTPDAVLAATDAAAADAAAPPVYRPPPRARTSRATLAWWAGCAVLALLLAVQAAWAHRAELYRDPGTRGWVVGACRLLPCRLPPIRDLARLEMLSRDIRPDPKVAGALVITATFRNDARFRQPWPVVVVSLTDLDDQPVAMRRFRPAEYLPDATRRAAGIAPGATAAVAFEVVDPGPRAVAFRFGFE